MVREVWIPGGEATVQELMAGNVIAYMEGVDVGSREEFLAERRRLMGAFPDLAIVADDVVAEGSKVGMASAFLRPIVECPFEG